MRIATVVFLTLLLLPVGAYAGQLEDGIAAYEHRDPHTALKLLLPLAEQGNAKAQLFLAILYEYPIGDADLKPDREKATKWYIAAAESYRKTADHGDAEAQLRLGELYRTGQGVPQDHAEALKWVRKSADQGFGGGQLQLGKYYERGIGMWFGHHDEAYFWFSLAVNSGSKDAIKERNAMAAGLSKEQIEALKKRVAEWKPVTAAREKP